MSIHNIRLWSFVLQLSRFRKKFPRLIIKEYEDPEYTLVIRNKVFYWSVYKERSVSMSKNLLKLVSLWSYPSLGNLNETRIVSSPGFFFQILNSIFEILTKIATRCNNGNVLLHLSFTLKIFIFSVAYIKSSRQLWRNFYCKNNKPSSIFTKSSIDHCLGTKYASAFWRLFKRFISLKHFTF